MRVNLTITINRYIYYIVLNKCETILSVGGYIFNIICTVLGNVSKSSLITFVTVQQSMGLMIRNECDF